MTRSIIIASLLIGNAAFSQAILELSPKKIVTNATFVNAMDIKNFNSEESLKEYEKKSRTKTEAMNKRLRTS